MDTAKDPLHTNATELLRFVKCAAEVFAAAGDPKHFYHDRIRWKDLRLDYLIVAARAEGTLQPLQVRETDPADAFATMHDRLAEIARIIDAAEQRCMLRADARPKCTKGPLLQEMTQEEITRIHTLAKAEFK